MNNLDNKERRNLTKLAVDLKPVLRIGKNGLTDNVVQAVLDILENNELIKIKFINFKDEKNDIAEKLSEKTQSSLVRIIGNNAVIYKKKTENI